MTTISDDRTVGTREAAAILGVSESSIRAWRARREGPPYMKYSGTRRGHGRARYLISDLMGFMESCRIDPKAESVRGG